ncbi:hypothetical protein AB0M43_34870 [Longispora sp. NPDC051575]|uniref:hypothetical protein n=1 Tax=Longispora sp. NPDC051575 TaxID=3154943 RepID=UPI0034460C38
MHQRPATSTAPAVPRTMPGTQMTALLETQDAVALSPQERHRMFVRYGASWWIASGDVYCEITVPDQIVKLDRWRRRLTEGALWG